MTRLFTALLFATSPLSAAPFERVDHGVIVSPSVGPARQVRVLAYGDDSFRDGRIRHEEVKAPHDALLDQALIVRSGTMIFIIGAAGAFKGARAYAPAPILSV